jgi:hypothetical protein
MAQAMVLESAGTKTRRARKKDARAAEESIPLKGRRVIRFVLCVVLGLALVLGLQKPALSASPRLQTTADWRGEYYANADLIGEPALVRRDAAINFDWGTAAPRPGIPADGFSVRWTRSLVFEEGIIASRRL